MDELVCFLGGLAVGVALVALVWFLLVLFKPDGIFHIDESDPKVDRYRMEMRTYLDKLPKRFWIVLQVKKDTRKNSVLSWQEPDI